MARKKSAARKAKDAEEAKRSEELSTVVDESVKKTVEEEFDSESDSSSEDEDDYGELITEDVDQGINKVLDAIKSGDKSLFDSNINFFGNPEEETFKTSKDTKQKPIYLKDYHRMNLLSGDANKELDDEDKPMTYAEEKEEERNELLSEIKNAFNEVDSDEEEQDSDDGFLKKKEVSESSKLKKLLPNPEIDEEKFLKEFANQHAWIPQDGDTIVNLDKRGEEDDEEFEAAAEKFENAYNFRYEDPNAAEIISYARNQATVRRNETNGRRKKRDEEKQIKIVEKQEKEKLLTKKKTEKVNKLTDILEAVKKEYGADLNEALVAKLTANLLDKDFDDSQWDNVLEELFNDEYYQNSAKKPTWDDDDEVMKGYEDSDDEGEEEQPQGHEDEDLGEVIESEKPPKKKSKKDELKDKKGKKKDKKAIKELAEKAIESQKLKIIDEVEEEREGRSKEKKFTFKYREVSPESFGLSTREIILADDAELNEFMGLKKIAPYRTKEQAIKDRRKYAKARNLKEWRKKVFKNEEGAKGDGDEILIPSGQVTSKKGSSKKVHKRKHDKLE